MKKKIFFWQQLTRLKSAKFFRQLLTYLSIGLLTNSVCYLFYILFIFLGGSPKIVMTLLYVIGALISFLSNRRFTFQHDGRISITGTRYLLVQLLGYCLNFSTLVILVDWLGFSHYFVQAIAIILVAIFSFIFLRVFVFIPSLKEKGTTRA